MGCPALVGSYETVARKIDTIATDPNIEGLLFGWPEWVLGIRYFGDAFCRSWPVVGGGMP